MRKGFEVNGDYRLMDSSELVYILTNSAMMVNKVQEKEVVYGEECSFEDVLAKNDPRKAQSRYGRCGALQTLQLKQEPKTGYQTEYRHFMTICSLFWGDNKTEECWAILMNSSARVIKRIRISSGGLNTCLIDIGTA